MKKEEARVSEKFIPERGNGAATAAVRSEVCGGCEIGEGAEGLGD